MARKQHREKLAFGHIRANATCYALAFVMFVAGVCTGAVYASAMREGSAAVFAYLESGLSDLRSATPGSHGRAMLASVNANLCSVAFVWLAGLSVLGFTGALLILFIRGFSIGFTVAFFVRQMGGAGAVLALSSVLPHNLVAVPALIAACASSVGFAWSVVKKSLLGIDADIGRTLTRSVASLVLSAVALVFAAFVQVYVSPAFLILAARFG
jgi:stage II sporulation protein M